MSSTEYRILDRSNLCNCNIICKLGSVEEFNDNCLLLAIVVITIHVGCI